jgi:hypothetical protein
MTNTTSDLCNLSTIPKSFQKCTLIDECPIETTTELIGMYIFHCIKKYANSV